MLCQEPAVPSAQRDARGASRGSCRPAVTQLTVLCPSPPPASLGEPSATPAWGGSSMRFCWIETDPSSWSSHPCPGGGAITVGSPWTHGRLWVSHERLLRRLQCGCGCPPPAAAHLPCQWHKGPSEEAWAGRTEQPRTNPSLSVGAADAGSSVHLQPRRWARS